MHLVPTMINVHSGGVCHLDDTPGCQGGALGDVTKIGRGASCHMGVQHADVSDVQCLMIGNAREVCSPGPGLSCKSAVRHTRHCLACPPLLPALRNPNMSHSLTLRFHAGLPSDQHRRGRDASPGQACALIRACTSPVAEPIRMD